MPLAIYPALLLIFGGVGAWILSKLGDLFWPLAGLAVLWLMFKQGVFS